MCLAALSGMMHAVTTHSIDLMLAALLIVGSVIGAILGLRATKYIRGMPARLLLAGFAILIGRALYLQVLHTDFLQQEGASRYARLLEVPAHRGMITDRYGEPLAISTPVESVWASPVDADLSTAQRKQLARLLDIDENEIARKLVDPSREFVYLKRHLPPEVAAK